MALIDNYRISNLQCPCQGLPQTCPLEEYAACSCETAEGDGTMCAMSRAFLSFNSCSQSISALFSSFFFVFCVSQLGPHIKELFRLVVDFVDVIGLRMKAFQDLYEVTDNLGQPHVYPVVFYHCLSQSKISLRAACLSLSVNPLNYIEKTKGGKRIRIFKIAKYTVRYIYWLLQLWKTVYDYIFI